MSTDTGSHFTHMAHSVPYAGRERQRYRTFHDDGITYGASKATHLYTTNINQASKPYGAPYQKSSRSVPQVMHEEAKRSAMLSATGPAFWFSKNGEIPISSSDQSNPNVEIPMRGQSFHGDPRGSLSRYARVYADVSGGKRDNNPTPFHHKRNDLHQGQPEIWEEREVPREDFIKEQANPWGPGGALQRLFGQKFATDTKEKGTHQDAIIRPPQTLMNQRRNYDS